MSETVPFGWAQTSASCTNGTPAAITVVAGATTTCIITNTKGALPPLGLITIVKNTVGGDGTFAFTSNFGLTSLTTTGGTTSQKFGNLTPGGSYSMSETVPFGWTQTSGQLHERDARRHHGGGRGDHHLHHYQLPAWGRSR